MSNTELRHQKKPALQYDDLPLPSFLVSVVIVSICFVLDMYHYISSPGVIVSHLTFWAKLCIDYHTTNHPKTDRFYITVEGGSAYIPYKNISILHYVPMNKQQSICYYRHLPI